MIVQAMNMMGYDAMTLAYADLLLGSQVLSERMAEADFAILSANVVDASTGEPFASPYVVRTIAGHTIAIIGATDGQPGPLPKGPDDRLELRLEDPILAVQRYAAEATQVADVLILLSHLGVPRDREISELVPEMDIIIGGYSRSLLAPVRFEDGSSVIAQAGYRGEWLGFLHASLNGQGDVTDFSGTSEALIDTYGDDAEMTKFVDQIKSGR